MPGRHTEFPSSDFAITSVNVGDRLDQRELDDRKQQDDATFYARRRWGSTLRAWSRRLVVYLVVLGSLGLAGRWLLDQRDNLAADRIAQRVSAALHVPVQIQDTRFTTMPPALVLSGVDLNGQIRFDEVDLQFTAPSLWQAVVSGHRRWGDVVISPITLRLDQANQLLIWLGALDRAVPDSVTRIRFPQVRFVGTGLLPDRYEVIARRESTSQFTSVLLRRLGTPGSMQLLVTPDPAGGLITFQCDATDWQPPFVPRTAWSDMVASGRASATAIELEKFTLGSAFGAIQGHLAVRRLDHAAGWSAEGQISTVGLDIPTLVQQVTTPGQAPADEGQNAATPMSGTAAIDAMLRGTGATPEEALTGLVSAGQIKVRGAELNGINLGYAASRPSTVSPSNSASTRFTKLDATFIAGSSGVLFRDVHAVAGALSTQGEVTVTPELALDGLLHVNLGGRRVQAPLRIHVRGTLAHPQYGR